MCAMPMDHVVLRLDLRCTRSGGTAEFDVRVPPAGVADAVENRAVSFILNAKNLPESNLYRIRGIPARNRYPFSSEPI